MNMRAVVAAGVSAPYNTQLPSHGLAYICLALRLRTRPSRCTTSCSAARMNDAQVGEMGTVRTRASESPGGLQAARGVKHPPAQPQLGCAAARFATGQLPSTSPIWLFAIESLYAPARQVTVHSAALWANTANFFPTNAADVDAAVGRSDVIVLNAGLWFTHLLPARGFKNDCAAWLAVNHFAVTRAVLQTLLSRTRARGTLVVWRTTTPVLTSRFTGAYTDAVQNISRGETEECDSEVWRQAKLGEAHCPRRNKNANQVPSWAWEGGEPPHVQHLASGSCCSTSLTNMGSAWMAMEELRAVQDLATSLPAADARRLLVVDAHQILQGTHVLLRKKSAWGAALHSTDGVHFRVFDMLHLRALFDVLARSLSTAT